MWGGRHYNNQLLLTKWGCPHYYNGDRTTKCFLQLYIVFSFQRRVFIHLFLEGKYAGDVCPASEPLRDASVASEPFGDARLASEPCLFRSLLVGLRLVAMHDSLK